MEKLENKENCQLACKGDTTAAFSDRKVPEIFTGGKFLKIFITSCIESLIPPQFS
jgi:hypothetical protein